MCQKYYIFLFAAILSDSDDQSICGHNKFQQITGMWIFYMSWYLQKVLWHTSINHSAQNFNCDEYHGYRVSGNLARRGDCVI